MRLGSLNRLGVPLAIVTIAVAGAYVSGGYVPGNYAQSGGYTAASGARAIDAAVDAPPDAATTTMSVAITDSADPVITGADAYSYSVTLTNSGSNPATSVSIATTIDSSLTVGSSSGTGWSCSTAGQVVTCTRASAAVGAQPAITINVTTGGGAVSASSSVVASATNAANATGSQGTTVQLVTKDATSGVYLPASSTEWTNFIARKGLSCSVPDALWIFGTPASGNVSDSIGSFTLTASGTGATYQSSVSGWSTKGITVTDGASAAWTSTSASLPDISTTSDFTVVLAIVSGTPAANRIMFLQGTTTNNGVKIASTPRFRATSGANFSDGAATPVGSVRPYAMRTNRTAASATGFTDVDKLTPTWTSTTTGKEILFGSGDPAMTIVYGWEWHGSKAEISDATFKACEQAMGLTISWN